MSNDQFYFNKLALAALEAVSERYRLKTWLVDDMSALVVARNALTFMDEGRSSDSNPQNFKLEDDWIDTLSLIAESTIAIANIDPDHIKSISAFVGHVQVNSSLTKEDDLVKYIYGDSKSCDLAESLLALENHENFIRSQERYQAKFRHFDHTLKLCSFSECDDMPAMYGYFNYKSTAEKLVKQLLISVNFIVNEKDRVCKEIKNWQDTSAHQSDFINRFYELFYSNDLLTIYNQITRKLIWEAEYYEALDELHRIPIVKGRGLHDDLIRRVSNYAVMRQGLISSGFEPDKRLEVYAVDRKVAEAQRKGVPAPVDILRELASSPCLISTD